MIGSRRAWGGALAGLALGGCAVVSPLIDRGMTDAPNAACALLDAGPGPNQCFALFEEGEGGARAAWSGGVLRPGRTLVAIHLATAPQCSGRFTHLTVTGASDGAGRAQLSTWDGLGRPGHAREIRWSRPFADRAFALASVDSALMIPSGARVRVTEGSFDPASLCLKSY